MNMLHSIHNLNINFWTIDGAIARVNAPSALFSELVHRIPSDFSPCPTIQPLSPKAFSSRVRELQLVRHTKSGVHIFHEVQSSNNLSLNLILGTVDVSIILFLFRNDQIPSD